jgi:hypothetical protein
MQFVFLILINHLIRNLIKSFGGDGDAYKLFCIPDIKHDDLKRYIFTMMKGPSIVTQTSTDSQPKSSVLSILQADS